MVSWNLVWVVSEWMGEDKIESKPLFGTMCLGIGGNVFCDCRKYLRLAWKALGLGRIIKLRLFTNQQYLSLPSLDIHSLEPRSEFQMFFTFIAGWVSATDGIVWLKQENRWSNLMTLETSVSPVSVTIFVTPLILLLVKNWQSSFYLKPNLHSGLSQHLRDRWSHLEILKFLNLKAVFWN